MTDVRRLIGYSVRPDRLYAAKKSLIISGFINRLSASKIILSNRGKDVVRSYTDEMNAMLKVYEETGEIGGVKVR